MIGKCKWRKNSQLCDRAWVGPLYVFNFKNQEMEALHRKMEMEFKKGSEVLKMKLKQNTFW